MRRLYPIVSLRRSISRYARLCNTKEISCTEGVGQSLEAAGCRRFTTESTKGRRRSGMSHTAATCADSLTQTTSKEELGFKNMQTFHELRHFHESSPRRCPSLSQTMDKVQHRLRQHSRLATGDSTDRQAHCRCWTRWS